MRKNRMFVIILFIANIGFAQINKGIITYKKEMLEFLSEKDDFQKKNAKNTTYLNNVINIDKNVKQLLKEIKFVLSFNTNESIFKSDDIIELENNRFYGFAVGTEGSKIYYSGQKEQENIHQIDAFGDLFLVTYPQIEWHLNNEVKKIGNFNCYKATAIKEVSGRKGVIKTPIEAWYTPELAIPFGPIGYNGLPGLIVELSERNYRYTIELIELNPTKQIEVIKPTKGIKVTKLEFEAIGKETMSSYKKGF